MGVKRAGMVRNHVYNCKQTFKRDLRTFREGGLPHGPSTMRLDGIACIADQVRTLANF